MATLTPSGEKLIVLLNETFLPPVIFSDQNLSFGDPSPAPQGAVGYDSVVIATGVPGRGYYGTAEIHYSRCPLSNLKDATIASIDGFTTDSIIAALNAQYKTFLSLADIDTISNIPTLTQGQSATVTLNALPTSLGWEGSTTVTLLHDKPYLSSVVVNQELAVLTDGKTNGFVDGRAVLFNIDFTSYRDALALTQYYPGQWYGWTGFADYNALIEVCQLIGLPWFPEPSYGYGITDNPTSAIPDSNKNFDRVVMYQRVASGLFTPGPIYFHYNILENR